MLYRAVLASLCFLMACEAQEPSVEVRNGWAKVNGVVSENVKNCEFDGPCYLVLKGNRVKVRVRYHYGEFPPCANTAATDAGMKVAKGARIAAEGEHAMTGAIHRVDVCCAKCSLKEAGKAPQ